jgi:hypothetical protein
MGTLKCSVTGRSTLGRQNPNKPFKIDFGVRGQSKRLVIIMDAYYHHTKYPISSDPKFYYLPQVPWQASTLIMLFWEMYIFLL